ncbi:unnamed protein product [Linum trigynum]|uniref:Uncharacterized protein n=1 Tax=Linum trigynum TaxID=586398 RepID=A0AAV2GNG5_9ROSI
MTYDSHSSVSTSTLQGCTVNAGRIIYYTHLAAASNAAPPHHQDRKGLAHLVFGLPMRFHLASNGPPQNKACLPLCTPMTETAFKAHHVNSQGPLPTARRVEPARCQSPLHLP